jgi:hypothetical protein
MIRARMVSGSVTLVEAAVVSRRMTTLDPTRPPAVKLAGRFSSPNPFVWK